MGYGVFGTDLKFIKIQIWNIFKIDPRYRKSSSPKPRLGFKIQKLRERFNKKVLLLDFLNLSSVRETEIAGPIKNFDVSLFVISKILNIENEKFTLFA